MKPTLYEVARNTGFLAIMGRPVGEFLIDDIGALHEQGVGMVVSLLTSEEAYELELRNEREVCDSFGLEFVSLPIPDRGVPSNVREVSLLAERIRRQMQAGSGVVIHCRAGIGRSSLIAATVLLQQGIAPEDAFSMISGARRVECPDTPEQVTWLETNAAEIQSSTYGA